MYFGFALWVDVLTKGALGVLSLNLGPLNNWYATSS